MSTFDTLTDRAAEMAKRMTSSLPANASKWLETGVALGAARSGGRVALRFARRNPVLTAAAVAGAGVLWYAARKRAKQAEQGHIEGSAKRIEATPARSRKTGD